MKILLLGAAGFIGTNLTIELAKKTEDEITLVDRYMYGLDYRIIRLANPYGPYSG